jgi:ribosome maturation protein SDO1
MSSGVKQPISQVRLTNIVFVRYDVGNQRFEIACFPNKVLDWRRKMYVLSTPCLCK